MSMRHRNSVHLSGFHFLSQPPSDWRFFYRIFKRTILFNYYGGVVPGAVAVAGGVVGVSAAIDA